MTESAMLVLSSIKKIVKSNLFLLIFLFGFSFIVYLSNVRYIGTTDTNTNETYADNISKTGNLYLDEKIEFKIFLDTEELPEQASQSKEVNGKHYSKYPISVPVLATPFYKAFHIIGIDNHKFIGKVIAAFITALSIPIFYLFLKNLTSKRNALFITLIYAFASSTWVISAQALWQHTFSQFFSILTLYLLSILIKKEDKQNKSEENTYKKYILFFVLGLVLGIGITIRQTNIVIAALFGLLVLFTRNKKGIGFTILGGLVPLILMSVYNKYAFGSILSNGYGDESSAGWITPFFKGFYGLLLSPSVGLLVFSPIFILAAGGLIQILIKSVKSFNTKFSFDNLLLASVIVFFANLIIYSKWWAWYGDSWAYRMIVDVIPFLSLGFIPFFNWLDSQKEKKKIIIYKLTSFLTIILFIFSFYVQLIGAFSYDYIWDVKYKVSWKDQSYLFDWPNSRLAYYLRLQKYYLRFPKNQILIIGDNFGNEIKFNGNKFETTGEKKIIHAVDLNTGRTPEVIDGKLVLDNKYDGLSFLVSDNFKSQKMELVIKLEESNANNEFQIKELKGGKEVKLIKYNTNSNTINHIVDTKADEIRIQNDEFEDNIVIKSISIN